jgi:hypothetical protein
MNLSSSQYILAIVAVIVMIFGALVLFSDKFLARMHKSLWRGVGSADEWFSEADSKSFDRYGRGLGAFIAGLILLAMLLIKIFGK